MKKYLLLLAMLLAAASNLKAAQTVVTLTFDDGYEDQIQQAVPLLDAAGYKGTFFVNTGDINTSGELSTAELNTMVADGHEIAGHTVDHLDLSTVTVSQQIHQVCDDRTQLIKLGFHPIDFAYPYGNFNASAEAVVKSCGYISARIVGGLDCPSGSCVNTFSSPIPPTDAFAVETPDSVQVGTTTAQIEQYVINAENNGGGWVPIVFHHVCSNACDQYSTSSSTLAGFLTWLQTQTSGGTVVVQTMAQVMGGDPTLAPPAITALSTTTVAAGSPAFTLTVTGLNFTAASKVFWNGVDLGSTTFVSATSLQAGIPASDLATVSGDSITVVNSGPGETSPFAAFTVGNPVPTLTVITPVSGRQGSPFIMRVVGNGFANTSKVRWNGTTQTTAFVSSTTLTATITAADLATVGNASVTVFTSTPGGGTSLPQTFVINPAAGAVAPYQIFPNTTIPAAGDANGGDTSSLELGVKFRADVDGTITGLRFYKIASSIGTHVGHLWSSTGVLLATVTYTGESASGWQTMALAAPVPITANTTYIASYETNTGYAISDNYFPFGFDNAPLHALANTVDVNGVFGTGGLFPTSTANSRNYWADVVFVNNLPTLASIAPNSAVVGSSTVTITVTGTNFISSSVFQWNGSTRTTSVVNGTTLNAVIPTSDLAQVKIATVTVADIGLGGTTTAGLPFTVGYPVPTLNSVSPNFSLIGSTSSLTVTLNGTNFIPNSTVLWNGSPIAVSSIASSTITITVPPSDLATAGIAAITVSNPAPGGGTTAAQNFAIGNPIPVLNSISPSSATIGGAGFTLTLTGSNFIPSSTVLWNGSPIAVVSVNASTITVNIPASALATAGTSGVTVTNSTPGGGTSASQNFVVLNPLPVLGSLSKGFANVGDPAFALTVTGSGFESNSLVEWNGTPRPTTFVSNTQLTADIPATDLAFASTSTVSVFSPAPAGGTSNIRSFFVTLGSGGSAGVNVVSPRVFPNPWRKDLHIGKLLTIDQLNNASTVKIFTASGHWVKTLSAPAGSTTWDLTNDSGDAVASGYYIYLVTDSTSNKVRGIIGIIR